MCSLHQQTKAGSGEDGIDFQRDRLLSDAMLHQAVLGFWPSADRPPRFKDVALGLGMVDG